MALLACGGGTDIAPSQPVVEGEGTATATLDGRDFGRTAQVGSGVSSFVDVSQSIVDEPITFAGGFAALSRAPLSSARVVITGPGGTPVYCQGTDDTCVGIPQAACGGAACDYWLENQIGGALATSPTTTIAGTVLADYSYFERTSSFEIGITFAAGHYVAIGVFNVPGGATAPITVTLQSQTAPLAPYPMAFHAVAETNLTTLGDRLRYEAAADPANVLSLTEVDVSDPQNACLAGTLHVMMNPESDPTILVPLDVTFETPGC